MAIVTTVASFNGVDGYNIDGGLVFDADGDLFGVAFSDTSSVDSGTIFEIAATADGFSSTPQTLFHFPGNFNGNGDSSPEVGLYIDSAGDLFGTVPFFGGTGSGSTVYELANTVDGYASTPTTLATFNGTTSSALVADAAGDLFGTTFAGGNGSQGTIFEIPKTATGFGSPISLNGGFTSTSGGQPTSGLYIDANGDLFGTTTADGQFNDGTVFEIANTPSGGVPVALASFDGVRPASALIADPSGDLFGVTNNVGGGGGTVFELVNTGAGFATSPSTLATFSGVLEPQGGLLLDANGDLFGVTSGAGMDSQGHFVTGTTVFEIEHTAAGYDSAPVTVATFSSAGSGQLVADAAGDLFGVTEVPSGVFGDGQVYEIRDSGFSPWTADLLGHHVSDFLIENANGSLDVGEVQSGHLAGFIQISSLGMEWKFAAGTGSFLNNGHQGFLIENTSGAVVAGQVAGGHAVYTTVSGLGPEWSLRGTGDFLGHGDEQFLIENTSGAVDVGEVVNGQAQYTQVASLGPEWSFKGTGDFLGDGKTDFLIENTSGAVVVGEVVSGHAQFTQVTGLGSEWKFVGTGDFLGNGLSDFLIENTSGAVDVGEVVNGQAHFTQIAGLGSEWKFVGAGDYLGESHDQFLIENSSGAVDVGDFVNGQIHFTQVTALGSEWTFH